MSVTFPTKAIKELEDMLMTQLETNQEGVQDSLTDNIQTFLREIPQEHHTEVSFLQDGSFHIYMMNNQFTCATEYRLVEVMQALVTLYGKCDE